MIDLIGDLPDGVAGFRMSGHVSGDDYKQVVLPLMKENMAKAGGIRLLVVIDADFDRFEAGAMWEDMKFGLGSGLTHLSKWSEWRWSPMPIGFAMRSRSSAGWSPVTCRY